MCVVGETGLIWLTIVICHFGEVRAGTLTRMLSQHIHCQEQREKAPLLPASVDTAFSCPFQGLLPRE